MTNHLKDTIKFIFVPALLLSVFLSGSSFLFHSSKSALIGKQIDFAQIPVLKASSMILQAILVLSLLFFSIYKPFEKVFRGTLITLTGMIALLSCFMLFLGNLEWTRAPDALGIYKPLAVHWPSTLMYFGLDLLSFNLFALLIWGFINRLVSSTEGTMYYIPITFVFGTAGAVFTNSGLALLDIPEWPLLARITPAIFFMIFSLSIFNWSWKRLPQSLSHPETLLSLQPTRFPYLSSAYLLAGCVMVKDLLNIIFKSQLKDQFPDPSSYSKFMGYYSTSVVGPTTLIISIIWAILGTWLILEKDWKTTALYASTSLFMGGIIHLCFSTSWISLGIFTGLLTGATSALFFPLIQMLYLYLPYQNRFKTKIVTEMVALPIMNGLPSLIIQGLLVVFGSIAAIAFYLKALVPFLLLLLVITSKIARPNFSNIKIKV